MTPRPKGRYIATVALAMIVAWATVEAFRTYLGRREGDLRAPLIAGCSAGIAFIIIGSWVVSRSDSAPSPAPKESDPNP